MGEARRRTAAPAMITVLIPERGRPSQLRRCISSLLHTAQGDTRFEILVLIDFDDPAWTPDSVAAFIEDHADTPVRTIYQQRPITLGEKLNICARERAQGSILFMLANDYVMETPGWPDRFRAAVATLPNGIGVLYPHDDLHPDHAAFPIIARRMVDAVGWFWVPWVGIGWYGDTWWDSVGILLGIRREIDVTVRAPEGRGKSHGIADLAFWASWFDGTLPLRAQDAANLASVAYGGGSVELSEVLAKSAERQRLCLARTAHLSDPAFIAQWEANSESPPSPEYPKVKAYAANLLADLRKQTPRKLRVAIAVPSGLTWNATTANCVAAMAAHTAEHNISLAFLNVQSSVISHSRNATVEIALKEGCDLIFWCDSDMKFPPDTLIRLLKYGKDIVGATYNRRVVDPKTKKYPTLGCYAASGPDDLTDDLNEMRSIPSGVLLVRTDVYRQMGWPWFGEAIRWPGVDGLEAFKSLLRNYFYQQPPEEALEELDDTLFGKWIRKNYDIGVVPDGSMMVAEDTFFCHRARRAGFKIWCSQEVTYTVSHMGEIAVTTLKASQTPVETKAAAD